MTRDEWLERYAELMQRQERLYESAIYSAFPSVQADLNVEWAMLARYAQPLIANSEYISDPDRTTDLSGEKL